MKYWPHWTAVIQEKKTGQRFAVDSWIYADGENPAVVEVAGDAARLVAADLEAVFEVAVIVLVGLGMDDDAVVNPRLSDELFVVVEIGWRRLISARGRVGETRLVFGEQVYVGVDDDAFRSRHDAR